MNKRVVLAGGVAAAILAGAAFSNGFGLLPKSAGPLQLYGNVDVRQVDLAFRVPGRIAAMNFDEGAKVVPGAELARLDTRTITDTIAVLDAQISQADADLAKRRNGNRPQEIAQAQALFSAQQARYEQAFAEHRRLTSLVPSGAASQKQLEMARGDMGAALGQLDQARAALALLRAGSRAEDIGAARAQRGIAVANRGKALTDLADASLRAPEGGTVLTRAREPGAIVQPGETVFTLTIDRPMRVRAYVSEPDMGRISPGMAVEVVTDGSAKTYQGRIGSIAPNAEFTPKTVQTEDLRTDLVYRVRIIINNPDDRLRQGQPVSVRIPGARAAAD